jgi:hypothetical protein
VTRLCYLIGASGSARLTRESEFHGARFPNGSSGTREKYAASPAAVAVNQRFKNVKSDYQHTQPT